MAQQDQSFGKYKLLARLAQEPTAEVFKAQNTETNQVVVLRLIHAAVSNHPQVARLFEERGELERFQVEHPNLLPVMDFGEMGQRRFFCVEYVEGKSLARRMKDGKVSADEGMDILRQTAEGLRALHQRHLFHGDLKPANILLTKDRKGRMLVKVSLMDLSVVSAEAMVSVFGEVVGTPKYMAPEIIAGERPSAQSDVFALGIVAYEMLCGHPPFHSETVLGFLHRNVNMQEKPLREMDPEIPVEFSLITHKMMAKSPDARYRSCQNLLDDLDRAERSVMGGYVARLEPGVDSAFTPTATPLTAGPTEPEGLSKRKIVGVALAVVGVGILLLAAWSLGARFYKHHHKGAEQALTGDLSQAPSEGLEKKATQHLLRAREDESKGKLKEARREYATLASKYPATKAAQDAQQKVAELDKETKTAEGKSPAVAASPALQAEYDKLNTETKGLIERREYRQAYHRYTAFVEKNEGAPEADLAKEQLPRILFDWAEMLRAGRHDAEAEGEALAKYMEIQEKYKDTEWAEKAKRALPQVVLQRAQRLAKDGDYDKAAEDYRNLAENYADTEAGKTATSKLPETLLSAAQKNLKQNEAEKAIGRLNDLISKYPNAPAAAGAAKLLPEALLLKAEALLGQDKTPEADAILGNIIEKYPSSEAATKAKDRRAEMLYAGVQEIVKSGKKQEGLAKFEELAAAYPNSPTVAAHQAEMNALKAQLAPPKPVEAAKPDPAQLYKEAQDLLAAGKLEDAMTRLEKVTQDFAKTPWAAKANELMAKAAYDEAIRLKNEGKDKDSADMMKDLAAQFPDTEWGRKAAGEQPPAAEPAGGMALVEAGPFLMGTDENEIRALVMGEEEADAKTMKDAMLCEVPKHEVNLPAYYIDRAEVTNAEYLKFVDETHRDDFPQSWVRGKPLAGKENDPVVYVSYEDAEAYAKWAGKRLPTEAEWEKAARGTTGQTYPWGRKFEPAKCNFLSTEHKATLPVGSFPDGASPCGCYDMVGNVAEWTASWFEPYPGNKTPQPEYGQTHRVVRGGAWNDTSMLYGRCASRRPELPEIKNRAIGFRCAKDAK